MRKIICRLFGHRPRIVEVVGNDFLPGRFNHASVKLIDEHVSCARCGKFIEYRIGGGWGGVCK